MSGPPPRSRPSRTAPLLTPARATIAVCLALPLIAMMWVDSYARVEPTLLGIPFFYWYQMLWVPITASLTAAAYLLVLREKRARKGGERQ